jgi:YhcH/YjgK/YiaL family protein
MTAQEVYTRQAESSEQLSEARQWMEQGLWRNGFTKAVPDSTVNAIDFHEQYTRNREQWDALFCWLDSTDVTAIPAGKHPIAGTTLVASVEDSENAPLARRRSESHYHHIDFQWVVRGTERFALIDHNTSTPNCEWRPDVIHYDYDIARTRFIDSAPDRFLIFFPQDWHIAKIENEIEGDDQQIRVIVIKVDYVDN